jgi:hypothetical protein
MDNDSNHCLQEAITFSLKIMKKRQIATVYTRGRGVLNHRGAEEARRAHNPKDG